MKTVKRSIAVLLMCVLGLSLAPVAHATSYSDGSVPLVPLSPSAEQDPNPEAKQFVTFGDSFAANAGRKRPAHLLPVQILFSKCGNDFQNWPHTAAEISGKTIGDWTCNGTGGLPVLQLKYLVESAIYYGDIGPETETIAFMYGGMDALFWENVGEDLLNVSIPGSLFNEYQQTMQEITTRLSYIAPNAQLVMVGYPEMTDGDKVCVAAGFGVAPGVRILGASRVLPAVNNVQRQAAEQNNMQFIDMDSFSRGHGPCQADKDQRWVAGYVDTAPHMMPAHPTDLGHREMGKIVAREVFEIYGD